MGDSYQPREQSTELPAASPTDTLVDAFDTYGKRTYHRDAQGVVTNYVYDLATGALVRKIEDANLTLLEDAPTGWQTPADGGAHLTTDYEVDDQGRTIRTFGPLHKAILAEGEEAIEVRTVQFTVYRDDIREVWGASGYATGTDPNLRFATVGPVRITRKDFRRTRH